jgi:1-acyl-sn-glycerol-3-phosphate acyltransferase
MTNMINKILWGLRLLTFYGCNLISAMFFFVLAAIFLPLPLPYRFKYKILQSWSLFFIFSAKKICGLRYQVTGIKNIPSTAAVVLSNHQSTWEAIFMQVLLPTQCWVLKRELLLIPFFGWALALLKPIAINRKNSNAAKQLLKQGAKRLRDGIFVIIFPEGTRVQVGACKPFKRSGAALAKEAGVDILPIAHNAGKLWPRGLWITKPGTIKVVIGKPIRSAAHSVAELTTWINDTKASL